MPNGLLSYLRGAVVLGLVLLMAAASSGALSQLSRLARSSIDGASQQVVGAVVVPVAVADNAGDNSGSDNSGGDDNVDNSGGSDNADNVDAFGIAAVDDNVDNSGSDNSDADNADNDDGGSDNGDNS
jgi:hypothetical protein